MALVCHIVVQMHMKDICQLRWQAHFGLTECIHTRSRFGKTKSSVTTDAWLQPAYAVVRSPGRATESTGAGVPSHKQQSYVVKVPCGKSLGGVLGALPSKSVSTLISC